MEGRKVMYRTTKSRNIKCQLEISVEFSGSYLQDVLIPDLGLFARPFLSIGKFSAVADYGRIAFYFQLFRHQQ